MKIAVRIIQNGAPLGPAQEETWEDTALVEQIERVTERVADFNKLLPFPMVVELEFLEETDAEKRFLRIGPGENQ